MPEGNYASRLTIGVPAVYTIIVGGELDCKWSGYLAGMRITPACHTQCPRASRLEGRVSDQAELFGVLSSLYDMQMPILSVELTTD